ncbi:hypothetical protein EHQ12_17045 [Leptospira gomenensis]|uniref:Uncharacterized protein n=1 Tax=Leptospira gomenensis TaxID=2484974 RepID=A0A5F1YF17_9LEPT|nr:hypothetical protein [Leptospira gomenensis]TGK33788.1 hypothetical protein EHQ12_17045 [Leptospira gomenensis]TGK36357.1 hypothetical protein EHQ17_04200 [Leptospira gomenensis]TGK47381.1 hypothetical protein EHQ07_05950 [Leptospira gomenensis]TGK60670.1 hypothetical protein EHQ13_10940 [Leptospira gomenensis]
MKVIYVLLMYFSFVLLIYPQPANDSYLQSSKVECLFPLEVENTWQYDIFYEGKKTGILRMEVLKKTHEVIAFEKFPEGFHEQRFMDGADFYDIKITDSYKKTTTYKQILKVNTPSSEPWVYQRFFLIKDQSSDQFYPFLRHELREGDQIVNTIVTSSGTKTFQGKTLFTVVLKDLEKDVVEEYMSHTGLYYYKNGALEYKLSGAMVKRCYDSEPLR